MAEAEWSGEVRDVLADPRLRGDRRVPGKGQPVRRRTVHSSAEARPRTWASPCRPLGPQAVAERRDLPLQRSHRHLRAGRTAPAEGRLAQVGELTAGIAHEFRNGLATIHGYARLIDLDRLPADTRPYVLGIRDETDTLGAVVRNFLNFAKPTDVVLMRSTPAQSSNARRTNPGRRSREAGRSPCKATSCRCWVTMSCCARRSATCAGTRSRPASRQASSRRRIESVPDRAQHLVRLWRSETARASPRMAARSSFPSSPPARAAPAWDSRSCRKIIVTHNGRVTVQPEPGGGTRFVVSLPMVAEEHTSA